MNILVTGSKGVVGSALVDELKRRGHRVTGVDIAHQPNEVAFHHNLYGYSSDYIRADVGNFREISRAIDFQEPDLVYHAAAEFGRWNGEDYYERLWQSNAIGTRNILELQKSWEFRAVYFSSSEIYGNWSGVMEETVGIGCNQLNDYAISKYANELQVINTPGIDAVRVRLFNTYGPGEHYSPYRSMICRFVWHLLRDEMIYVSLGHERSNTWLPDCVRALANIADNFRAGQVYNIGTSKSETVENTAEIIRAEIGADHSLVNKVTPELQTTSRKIVDNSLAKKDLGYRDTVDLKTGIRETVSWMRNYATKAI